MKKGEILYYVEKRKKGWDNSEVRKEIKRKYRFNEKDISFYISQIDDLYVESLSKPVRSLVSKRIQIIIQIIFGFILLVIASVMSYFGLLSNDVMSVKIIGILLVGGSSLIVNANRQKRNMSKDSVKIKRNYNPKGFLDFFK